MNSLKFFFLLSLSFIGLQNVLSQEIAYGFKAGLNFNSFIADSELDANGNELESFTNKTGFHVGATFTWKATELMGLRGEFLYTQKGGKYRYQGPSFYTIPTESIQFPTIGTRDMTVNVSNSYIDIPIMGYARLFKWLEVSAGANVAILISSTGFGSLRYDATTPDIAPFTYELDYRFGRDEPGESETSQTTEVVMINGESFQLPRNAGAYFEYTEDRGRLYNVFDFGLVGGLSFYLNEGLYIGFRANYGLTDVTKTNADVSWQQREANGNLISRDDNDKNLSIQASVGFSF